MKNKNFILGMILFFTIAVCFGLEKQAVGKRYAILIGINDYVDTSIVKLSTPRNDVIDLGTLLVAEEWDKVFIMRDDLDYRNVDFPSRINIENRIHLLADLINPEDTIFIFFSGHGVSLEHGSSILPVDASVQRLAETSISLTTLISAFSTKGLRKLIVALDACREEISTTKGLSIVGAGDSDLSGKDHAAALALFATKSGWYSYEDVNGRNGVFTRIMLEGLSGKADIGFDSAGDGIVTFAELAQWLPEATATYALDKGFRQQAVAVHGSGDLSALDVPVVSSVEFTVSNEKIQKNDISSSRQTIIDASKTLAEAIKEEVRTAISQSNQKKNEKKEKPEIIEKEHIQDSKEDRSKISFSLLQVSIAAPIQFVSEQTIIGGLAVGIIYTKNQAVYGIQAAPIATAGTIGGIQSGFILKAENIYGAQIGGITDSSRKVCGIQAGFINEAQEVRGLQIGFINKAYKVYGVQIGCINIMNSPGLFGSFMFGLNIGF